MKTRKTTHAHLVNIAWLVEARSSMPVVIKILNHRLKVIETFMVLKIEC